MRGKKVLVTGAAGFVGSALVKKLKSLGAVVTALDMANADINNFKEVVKFIGNKKIDLVYHLAAVSYVPFSWEDPQATYQTNLLGTMNVLELCRKKAVKKLVFMSSYVYGRPRSLPIDELQPIAPTNPYAWSKYLGEQLCLAYAQNYGLNCVILRPFNVYGPGQRTDFLVPTIINQMKKGGKVVLGDLRPKRDFLYLDDLLAALLAAGRAKLPSGEVFNLGSGRSVSVKELVALISSVSGHKVSVKGCRPKRRGEIMEVRADNRKARRLLGWRPEVGLEQGLKMVWNNG